MAPNHFDEIAGLLAVESVRIREELPVAIESAGACRRFKDALGRHRMESAWFAFRKDALKKIAIKRCAEHHIAWT
jgi:hypothetical protein